jgi:hypothetical protein
LFVQEAPGGEGIEVTNGCEAGDLEVALNVFDLGVGVGEEVIDQVLL